MGQTTKDVPVPATIELAWLGTQVDMWRAGRMESREMRLNLFRTYNKLRKACWCAEDLCCAAHGRHVTPHRDCLLHDR